MPTSQNLSSLVINKVESEEVYNYMKNNQLINDNELYLTPDTSVNNKTYYITLTTNSDGTYTADKKAVEILSAYNSGQTVVLKDAENDIFAQLITIYGEESTVIEFGVAGVDTVIIYSCENDVWSCDSAMFVINQWTSSDEGKYLQINNYGEVYADYLTNNDFTVTATLTSLDLTTTTVDKTFTEIEAAYQAGKNIICNLVVSGSDGATVRLSTVERLTSSGTFVFSGFIVSNASNSETHAAVFLKITSDGNTFTKKTLTS